MGIELGKAALVIAEDSVFFGGLLVMVKEVIDTVMLAKAVQEVQVALIILRDMGHVLPGKVFRREGDTEFVRSQFLPTRRFTGIVVAGSLEFIRDHIRRLHSAGCGVNPTLTVERKP